MSKVRNLPEITSLANEDLFYVVDDSAGPNGGRKIKKENLTAKAELHKLSHSPGGSDALVTAAPIATDADGNNLEGSALSFARSDHKHNVTVGTPSTQTPDQVNAAGASSALARADHIHNVPSGTPVNANADGNNDVGVANAFSRSDHKHNISVAAPISQATDQANAAGTSPNLSRADHIHNIPTASPVSTGIANTQGSSANFARADHIHNTVVASQEATATADDTTTSLTDVLIASMTQTPLAGTYLVLFSGSVKNSANGAERTWISLWAGGAQVPATERVSGVGADNFIGQSTQAVITVNGAQAIEARWRCAGGTSTIHSRRLTLVRLG